MIQYDKYYEMSEADLLLLNIARLRENEPPHFMMLSSINNTVTFSGSLSTMFDWAAGAKPPKGNSYQAGPFSATTSESPLFSLLPIQGQDFTNKLYSPLTNQAAYLLLRDQQPRDVLSLMGEYVWVVNGDAPKGIGCHDQAEYATSPDLRFSFVSDCSYFNNPLEKTQKQQDKFLYLVDRLDALKDTPAFYMERLPSDIDAGEVLQTSTTPPTDQEREVAVKDGFRWITKSTARYELKDQAGKTLATSSVAPTPADMSTAATKQLSWTATGEGKYQLIHPAQYADKMFAILDFDTHDNLESKLSNTAIREKVQPDPQDFIYVELRHHGPPFSGYIKIRDFVEILTFLARGSELQADDQRQFVGVGLTPPSFTPERLIVYDNWHVWVPASQDYNDRDRRAFALVYTLYQMSQVDTTKLPQIPVTISK